MPFVLSELLGVEIEARRCLRRLGRALLSAGRAYYRVNYILGLLGSVQGWNAAARVNLQLKFGLGAGSGKREDGEKEAREGGSPPEHPP